MGEAATFVTIETAQELLLKCVVPGAMARVSIAEALNRVLAEPVVCDVDYPPFDRAMMDGYAVRSGDVSTPARRSADGHAQLQLVGQVAAGSQYGQSLEQGQAVQINTGAPVPSEADTVVRVEDTEATDDGIVTIKVDAPAGKHIDRQAKYLSAGAIVLDPGTRLTAGPMSAAAAAGAAEVVVYRQPRVSILVTGDELVDASVKPTGGQLRNSNGPMLRALVSEYGAEPIELGVVGDNEAALKQSVRQGLEADILCLTGGISMGAFDMVPEVLSACGVEVKVRKIAIKPGKPTLFGTTDSGTVVVALAGNPVSAFMGFLLLVGPAIEAREGRSGRLPMAVSARLVGTCPPTANRQSYWPVRIEIDRHGELRAERLSWHGSGDPFGLGQASGLMVRPAESAAAAEGDSVSVIPLARLW